MSGESVDSWESVDIVDIVDIVDKMDKCGQLFSGIGIGWQHVNERVCVKVMDVGVMKQY